MPDNSDVQRNEVTSTNSNKDKDVFRETGVRYLGYANEVGESFRAFISRLSVYSTYGVSIAYVLADTADKAYKKHKQCEEVGKKDSWKHITTEALDTVTWQSLASVVIPGFTINRLVALSRFAMKNVKSKSK